jgi:cysteine/O-acetylserine efflux protein
MNILSFLLYCVIVTITPGPTNIAILSIAHSFRFKKALRYVCGATAAMCILLSASVLLNSALAMMLPKVLIVMRIIGCLYMLYLAHQISGMNISEASSKQTASFISGFFMQFVNPKVWLFTMTVIPSVVMPYYKASVALSISVLAITTIAFLSMVAWVFFGKLFEKFLQKYQKTVNIILVILLIYSAIEISGIIDLLKR